MKLSKERIKQEAGSDIFRRGERYYFKKRVKLIRIELDKIEAEVEGKIPYQVTVQEIGENLYSSCTCPYWTTCKHVVATLLEAKDWYEEHNGELQEAQKHPSWKKFFDKVIQAEPEPKKKQPQLWRVVYLLDLNAESWSIMPQKAYIKKNGLLGRFSNIGEFDLNNKDLIYAPNDPIVVSHIQKTEQQHHSFYNTRYFGRARYTDMQVYHYKYGSRLGPLFDLLHDSLIYLNPYVEQVAPIKFSQEPAHIDFEFEKNNGSYHLVPLVTIAGHQERLNKTYKALTEEPIWLLKDNMLYKVENMDKANLLVPFTKNDISLTIPETEFPAFLEGVYPHLSQNAPVPLPKHMSIETLEEISQTKIYLEEGDRHLHLSVTFQYGPVEVDALDRQTTYFKQDADNITQVNRDTQAESDIWETLLSTGLKEDPKGGLRIIDSKALQWLFNYLPKLTAQGFEFYGREQLKKYKVRTGTPNVRVAVSSNIDWFDLNIEIDIEGILLSLKELRKSIRQNSRYVKLADKSIAQLPEEWFDKFQHLFNFTSVDQDSVQVSQMHVTLVDTLFQEAEAFETDERFRASVERLEHFETIKPQSLPQSLEGVLRNYQKSGYDWLYFLQEYGFGGCLADDMGLGKTIQTLAMLLKEKQNGNSKPSLIVCPTSVVFNWEKEVQKFVPELSVYLHTGLNRTREMESFDGFDIILTSYGIMRRDIVLLKDYNFHYVILDESQKIKNPASQTAKAARLLKSKYRLVLTGTPVENNTIELWSQFAFLNPGLLGSLQYFKRSFTLPIEKYKEEAAAEFLRQMIYPFILRRTKEGVAKELPPKIEQTFFCAMNPEQEKLYAYWRDYYRAMILDKIDQFGIDRSRMNILEGLVKLRQISCHPYLVNPEVAEDSGKFESLKEVVEEILAENHKILIFSQFVKMLKLIRHYLNENHVEYEYLDGHTTNRKEHVDRFQTDDKVKIFLISLKAGGVGLNLTAADYVIHYDPWWNPAVEVQATDRAHRIGQDKKVFVYRLITKGSVEEKMLELQAQKRKLVSDLISTDSSFFKSLTRDDIDILFG